MSRPGPGPRDSADWLVAHRGIPHSFPENSVTGVRAALEAGARFVEFDVQMTRDEVPVVLHDDNLARVSGSTDEGDDEVGALDWSALADRSIGEPGRFGPKFAHERIPSLADMLALIDRYRGVTAFVEIKRQSLERFGTAPVVESVHAELRRAATRCVPISFDAAALEAIRARGAGTIGLGIKPWNVETRSAAERLAPDYLFIRHDRIPDGDDPFWPGDWQWVVYTVDDPGLADTLIARGADLIETNRFPGMLEDLRGASGPGGCK
ncbi:MAG: glycerophosphodiester phosphodiesterase family protein [Wenzhouxiangellaceae bacterium]|nr:glycerophosphodiester phosphodiesterase family protein [Wenzhouxiangellaceae bacterium]